MMLAAVSSFVHLLCFLGLPAEACATRLSLLKLLVPYLMRNAYASRRGIFGAWTCSSESPKHASQCGMLQMNDVWPCAIDAFEALSLP